ncbi:MAG: D-glycero-beta-D-manno-heptose 1-phosphate adenylyltransferase [Bacteroidales bacterium]
MKPLQNIENKILQGADFDCWLENKRPEIPKLVFTNGCFDLIHRGHVFYLAKAAALGSHLLVALNTDKSVKKIKGDSRPVQDQLTRAYVMAAFEFVDFVVFFNEDTPENIIRRILPDVLVKGGDYDIENIVGHDIVSRAGGEVKTIDFVKSFSTSKIIERI